MRANNVFLPAVIYCFQSHFWKLLFWNFPDLNTVPSKLRAHFFRRAEKCAVLTQKKISWEAIWLNSSKNKKNRYRERTGECGFIKTERE